MPRFFNVQRISAGNILKDYKTHKKLSQNLSFVPNTPACFIPERGERASCTAAACMYLILYISPLL